MKDPTATVIAFLLATIIYVGMYCVVGYAAVWTAAGFGHTLPYWPTVVGIWLLSMLRRILFPMRAPEKDKCSISEIVPRKG